MSPGIEDVVGIFGEETRGGGGRRGGLKIETKLASQTINLMKLRPQKNRDNSTVNLKNYNI